MPIVASASLAVGSATTDKPMLQQLLEQYQVHFQKLVLKKKGDDESAFAMVMFVRIVSEICEQLRIPEGFKHGLKPYRSPNTFGNYCTIKLNAEALLNHLETECPESEGRYVTRAKELLRTPLADAMNLIAGQYGKIKNFEHKVKTLMIRYELVMPKEEEAQEEDY
jgi:hypothetical protein